MFTCLRVRACACIRLSTRFDAQTNPSLQDVGLEMEVVGDLRGGGQTFGEEEVRAAAARGEDGRVAGRREDIPISL